MVDVRELDAEHTVVERVHPRTSTVGRRNAGGRETVMAANVGGLVIVASFVDPPLRLELVDRLIAFAECHALEAILVLTKADLVRPEVAESTLSLYRSDPLNYVTLQLNPRAGAGVEEFRNLIAGRCALLVGPSGVGKSTLFGKLGGTSVVGEVSRHGRGRQTTTAARLFQFGGGFLIDSAGIGEFVSERLEPGELVAAFRDLREPATRCRFRDCRHLTEPGCGVREAVAAGVVAASRYRSYTAILAEASEAVVW
jgi:ribosome biogenesis GTPase